jgi:hypothetical protein
MQNKRHCLAFGQRPTRNSTETGSRRTPTRSSVTAEGVSAPITAWRVSAIHAPQIVTAAPRQPAAGRGRPRQALRRASSARDFDWRNVLHVVVFFEIFDQLHQFSPASSSTAIVFCGRQTRPLCAVRQFRSSLFTSPRLPLSR